MPACSHLRAAGFAAIAAGVALCSVFATAHVVQGRALHESHELPPEDNWSETVAPVPDAKLHEGRTLFLDSCAQCHGADARGDEGPDLHELQVSDRYIARVIAKGIKGEMPAFKKKLGAEDIRTLTLYLRSLE